MATAAPDITEAHRPLAPTLDEIGALFVRLSEENQLRLIDFLADRTDYADELAEGTRKAAIAFGAARGVDEFEAEALADQVSFMGSTPAGLQTWRTARDRQLRHSLSWSAARVISTNPGTDTANVVTTAQIAPGPAFAYQNPAGR